MPISISVECHYTILIVMPSITIFIVMLGVDILNVVMSSVMAPES